jgi:tight adherence protein C
MGLNKGSEAKTSAILVTQAGFRSQDTLMTYFAAKALLPFGLGVLGFFLFVILGTGGFDSTGRLLAVLISFAVGYYVPGIYLKNMRAKRYQEITKHLPDMLDLFVICAESGLSLNAAIERVSKEIRGTCEDLGQELELLSVELGFLNSREEALLNFRTRVDLPAIRSLVTTLVQTERYGTPLAQALRILATEFREARLLRAEEKAARLPALITMPMLIFFLPPIFIILLTPGILTALDSSF